MNTIEILEFIAIFTVSNAAAELIKYLAVKVYAKIDSYNETFLD